MNKKGIIFFIEGDTEIEFYKNQVAKGQGGI